MVWPTDRRQRQQASRRLGVRLATASVREPPCGSDPFRASGLVRPVWYTRAGVGGLRAQHWRRGCPVSGSMVPYVVPILRMGLVPDGRAPGRLCA
eukprot:11186376-Lingulodinium_polyedra.AAC.1